MRTAERFLSQGKIRAAIGEYRRIVENDPKDFSTLNIMGDLYVKTSEAQEAVNCYTTVAEHYSKQGFAQKAIAIYNKISRLQPNSAEVSAKLAKLYQLKGSFAEARSHYVVLAEQFQSRGQKAEALEIWKQIAELDPNNTEVYLKIAENCWQDGNKDEAAKAFTEAGHRLIKQGSLESALTSFSRALEIRPYDLNALNGYVNTQVKLGYADDAAKKLEEILEKQPYNREILHLLVDCYLDVNNAAEAEKAVIRLVEQEPANYPKFLDLVAVYIRNDNLESAVRILSMSSEHLLVGGRSDDFLKWTNEILARNPEQLDALRLLVRYYSWQRDESELKKALERLAEIARLKDSVEDESYALGQLVMIIPHEVSYARRLAEINYHIAEPVEPVVQSDEIPHYENIDELDGKRSDLQPHAFEGFDDYAREFSFSEPAGPYDDAVYGKKSAAAETHDFAMVGGDFETGFAAPAANTGSLRPADEMRLSQELDSIEFYITQGYLELADKSLAGLEAEFGHRPEINALRAQIDGFMPSDDDDYQPVPARPSVEEAKTVAPPPVETAAENPPAEAKPTAAAFDFMDDFRSELGLEESEPADEGDYETHYQLATAYKEMGLMEEAIREFQDAINLVRVDDGTRRFFQCCNLLGLCFMEQGMPNLALLWYRRAIETPGLNEEEKQALLYEMAIAYEMGGESPKALECFEQIYAVNVDYRDVSARLESLREHHLAM
ncbi:MAG: tetratricopeptide repeat protein [Acidobacteria bacterium]|nr:tetratricopeptide repeat protein [Acidobacteriota bacterium]